METYLEASLSQVSLWWTKLGKWQALMVVATLAAFFITLSITGDTKDAAVVAGAITFVTFIVAVVASACIPAIIAFGVSATVAASAVFAAATAFAIGAVITVAVAVVFVAVFMDEAPSISKKGVWASYMGEFLLILLPMLWVVRG